MVGYDAVFIRAMIEPVQAVRILIGAGSTERALGARVVVSSWDCMPQNLPGYVGYERAVAYSWTSTGLLCL
jgi:hypothetical protein